MTWNQYTFQSYILLTVLSDVMSLWRLLFLIHNMLLYLALRGAAAIHVVTSLNVVLWPRLFDDLWPEAASRSSSERQSEHWQKKRWESMFVNNLINNWILPFVTNPSPVILFMYVCACLRACVSVGSISVFASSSLSFCLFAVTCYLPQFSYLWFSMILRLFIDPQSIFCADISNHI